MGRRRSRTHRVDELELRQRQLSGPVTITYRTPPPMFAEPPVRRLDGAAEALKLYQAGGRRGGGMFSDKTG